MTPAWLNQAIATPSSLHRQQALERQQQLTKPLGALGQLEQLVVDLAALQSTDHPRADHVPVIIFAADHGVTAEGVSAYPAEVTHQMLANFAQGGAAISVLSQTLDLPLTVVDVGTYGTEPINSVLHRKVQQGTANLAVEPAMSEQSLITALTIGRGQVLAQSQKADLFILGEMGIGNTTAATALSAALTQLDVAALTGAGTGLVPERIAHKQAVIERALALHTPFIKQAHVPVFASLRRLGGLEIAAMTGAIITAAQQGIPVLIDGFIVTAAALAAVQLVPDVRAWLLFSHCSAEQGHRLLLEYLTAQPLLNLGMRLGEGSGAAVALSLVRSACALHNQMATFAEAAVSNRDAQ